MDERRVVVVLASYAPADQTVNLPMAETDPVAALWPHVRLDWEFDPGLNTHHLPRSERDRATYTGDAANRLAELVTTAPVLAWRHHGELTPLLNTLPWQGALQ